MYGTELGSVTFKKNNQHTHAPVSVSVPHIGQNLHELDWQKLTNHLSEKCRYKILQVFQYNRLEAERPLTQTPFRLAADRLSCAHPRLPHFGRFY